MSSDCAKMLFLLFLNFLNAPNFIRISISSMKKSYLKITYELLSTKLCDSPPDFIFSIYYHHGTIIPCYHQAINLIESKIYTFGSKVKEKTTSKCVQYIF